MVTSYNDNNTGVCGCCFDNDHMTTECNKPKKILIGEEMYAKFSEWQKKISKGHRIDMNECVEIEVTRLETRMDMYLLIAEEQFKLLDRNREFVRGLSTMMMEFSSVLE
eukprot:TRINITY_DN4480_c0_g1_i1.p1 TRINITY_DN4480_c0_g1~~TRINITY_DN4480_c0_g1_i1.p1  ORF type:complete len:109 (-),score=8.38 TRINITY_DN4480_c0_g1_i1:276-602(-)